MNIEFPHQVSDGPVTTFLNDLFECLDQEELIIDFNPINFVHPYGTLLAALGIRKFVQIRRQNGLETDALGLESTTSAIGYLKYFCFFKFIGLEEGNTPNTGNSRGAYLPITIISRGELDDPHHVFQENIERKSLELAQVIFSSRDDEMKAHMLSFCLREIIRNSFEHAEVDECFVMAQKWGNGFAEIAIADEGVGIYNSLRKAHSLHSVEEAIKHAILPGITEETAPDDTNNKWQNSGFGLYIVSELGREHGDFAITSNNLIIHKHNNIEAIEDIPLEGTLVKLRVKTDDAEYFSNILHNIIQKGEKEALNIAGARASASKQSKTFDPTQW